MRRYHVAGIAGIALLLVAGWLVGSVPADAATPNAAFRVARYTASNSPVTVQIAGYAGTTRTVSLPAGSTPTADAYAPLPPGPYVISVKSGLPNPVLVNLDARSGAAYTVGVLVSSGTLQAVLVQDDLTAPPAGSGRVRVVQADDHVSRADVTLMSGSALARDADYTTVTGYRTVPAGTCRVHVAAGKQSAVVPVSVPAGGLITLVLIGTPSGGLAVRTIADAAGAHRDPGGPVPAGGGGMAAVIGGHSGGPPAAVIGVLELLGVFAIWAALHAVVARRRRTHRTSRRAVHLQ